MNRLAFAVMTSLLLVSTAVADGVSGKGTITFVSSEVTGVFIQIKSASSTLIKADPDGCGRNYLFMLDKNNPLFTTLYAAILTAYASGAPTLVKLSGCAGTGGDTWPLISYVTQGDYQAP